MKIKEIISRQNLDAQGDLEIFTFDLFPLIPDSQTVHLNSFGIPNVGTIIKPGMIIIGKCGKSKFYKKECLPNSFEIHSSSHDELRKKYGFMYYDGSVYADEETKGVVEYSSIESLPSGDRAVVRILLEN